MAHTTAADRDDENTPRQWHGAKGDLSEHPGDPETGAHGDHPSVLVYWVVFGLLMVLLVAAVVVGFLIGGLFGTILSFVIGIAKAVLIVLYFMHVRYGTRLTWIFSGAAFLWLAILLTLTMSDYLTRDEASRRAEPMSRITTTDTYEGPLDRP